jgi:hypothetical protein
MEASTAMTTIPRRALPAATATRIIAARKACLRSVSQWIVIVGRGATGTGAAAVSSLAGCGIHGRPPVSWHQIRIRLACSHTILR